MKLCPFGCGGQNTDDAVFCIDCGQRLSQVGVADGATIVLATDSATPAVSDRPGPEPHAIDWPALLRSRRVQLLLALLLVMALVPVGRHAWPFHPAVRFSAYTLKPMETGFVIPADQSNVRNPISLKYLEGQRLVEVNVVLPYYRSTMDKYMPTQVLYLVDRTPVSRMWDQLPTAGSDPNVAFAAASREAITVYIGASCSASVSQEHAALFLYNYAGMDASAVADPENSDLPPAVYRQASVAAVMDREVRPYIQHELLISFTNMPVSEIQRRAGEIVRQITSDAKAHFQDKGLDLDNCGAGELTFADPRIGKALAESEGQAYLDKLMSSTGYRSPVLSHFSP